MNRFARSSLGLAALAAAVAATPTLALARHHPWRAPPSDVVPPLSSLSPPPQLLYPQPKSSAYADANRHYYVPPQVPLGRASPGVTPYEMLPNKP